MHIYPQFFSIIATKWKNYIYPQFNLYRGVQKLNKKILKFWKSIYILIYIYTSQTLYEISSCPPHIQTCPYMMSPSKVHTKTKGFVTNLRMAQRRNRDRRERKTHPNAFIFWIYIGFVGGYDCTEREKSV